MEVSTDVPAGQDVLFHRQRETLIRIRQPGAILLDNPPCGFCLFQIRLHCRHGVEAVRLK